ncbi:MAG: polymerase sigma-54 factor RpoN [Myxococcaceae bacterium]|nr:polymerase sigma-54 factor RpoN [Myxococcaceae bacterium]
MSDPPNDAAEALSDEAIVARIRAGEAALFELLIRRNNRRLYRAVRATLGRADDDEVMDVVQDAYVRAFTHLGTFEGRARFSTWLTRIAVFESLARRRRWRAEHPAVAGHEEEREMDDAERAPDPERKAAGAEMRRVIEAAVDALPDGFRAVFVLRAVEEMSVAETAECLDIPEDTVKSRLHRARALLQQSLAQLEVVAPTAFSFDGPRCDRVTAAVLGRLRLPPDGAS